MRHALVICTYHRPRALRRTLRSVAEQSFADPLLVVVVEKDADGNLRGGDYPFELVHVHYAGPPSAARQRNAGFDRLPPSVEYVFFLDDDVELLSGYLDALCAVLDASPDVGGAGGLLLNEASPPVSFLKHCFLLVGARFGQVLSSGRTAPAQTKTPASPVPTEWLSTCSSVYRRALLERHRFDENVPGALLEDLDLSYRISRETQLVVEPEAQLIHHRSARSRSDVRARARMDTVQRYWFVEKNINHPLRKPAFWWSVLGRLLALLTSRKPERKAALRGLWQGMRTVWQRDHPLLQRNHG